MISILNNLTTRIKGTVYFPEWDYVQQGLKTDLDQTQEYYRNGAYAVESHHELIKLLFGLATSVDLELNRFYKTVDAKALTVAQQLGFTTTMSKGRMFSNVFFGGNSREVIIVTDEPFDPIEVTENWRDVRPIQVLRHGFDQIDCFPLNGKVVSNGISVFAINLPMLAVQYRAYRNWQETYKTEDTGRNSIYHFCAAYPINNLIYSSMDHAIFNRMIRIRQGLPTSDNQFRHPFHVTNFTQRVDRILKMINEFLSENAKDLVNTAMTIPLVNKPNARKLMLLPDIAESRQVNWAILLARLDMLLFFMSFNHAIEKQNQEQVSKLKYTLRLYLRDGTVQSAIPADLYEKQKAVIEELIDQM